MYSQEYIDLSAYRLEKAKNDLRDAKKTLEFEMYDTAANRSYYAIFHAARAVLALDGSDYKKHSGVIRNFQKNYIKTAVFNKKMSEIIKNAFDLRTESDYEDFYVLPKEDVFRQVEDAEYFVNCIENILTQFTKNEYSFDCLSLFGRGFLYPDNELCDNINRSRVLLSLYKYHLFALKINFQSRKSNKNYCKLR